MANPSRKEAITALKALPESIKKNIDHYQYSGRHKPDEWQSIFANLTLFGNYHSNCVVKSHSAMWFGYIASSLILWLTIPSYNYIFVIFTTVFFCTYRIWRLKQNEKYQYYARFKDMLPKLCHILSFDTKKIAIKYDYSYKPLTFQPNEDDEQYKYPELVIWQRLPPKAKKKAVKRATFPSITLSARLNDDICLDITLFDFLHVRAKPNKLKKKITTKRSITYKLSKKIVINGKETSFSVKSKSKYGQKSEGWHLPYQQWFEEPPIEEVIYSISQLYQSLEKQIEKQTHDLQAQ